VLELDHDERFDMNAGRVTFIDDLIAVVNTALSRWNVVEQ
jgi:hypothetical protein